MTSRHQGPHFKVHHQSQGARTGTLSTVHGTVETPAFYFCATKATLKGLSVSQIPVETQLLLCNTYHLMLQPGAPFIAAQGGLHEFMGWKKPVFTDSGGYQIFSLSHGSVSGEIKGGRRVMEKSMVKIQEEGALFTSYIDGKKHLLTPEYAVEIQSQLGADFICVLDQCTPLRIPKVETEAAMHRSHRWAERSLAAFQTEKQSYQGLYGIVQGGVYRDLRLQSAGYLGALPFFGHAIGGSLGENQLQMQEVIAFALEALPRHKPVHLLGIGGIKDIFYGVSMGIDTFDCVSPTRLGRHGGALIRGRYWMDDPGEPFHRRSHINLWKQCFREDKRPIDRECGCDTCQCYSRAYLHHLLKAKELLALSALTLHNVYTMNALMAEIREAIPKNALEALKRQWLVE